MFVDPAEPAPRYRLGVTPNICEQASFDNHVAPKEAQDIWSPYRQHQFTRSCITHTNVAESGVTVANVGLVISSGVHRRVSIDVRTGVMEGDRITMMSYDQFTSQARSQDLAQLEESDLTPMILRS